MSSCVDQQNCELASSEELCCCCLAGLCGGEFIGCSPNIYDCNPQCIANSISNTFFNSPAILIPIAIWTGVVAAFLSIATILGITQNFNSKGPLILALFGSGILSLNLTGLRIQMRSISSNHYSEAGITKLGRFIIIHSHHNEIQRMNGHEFKIKEKYFCTGCYGILIGTIIAIGIALLYSTFGFSYSFVPFIYLLGIFCFVPIFLRYTFDKKMNYPFRLLANILLPIGCSLLIIIVDFLYQSWIHNVLLIIFIVSVAFLRGMAGMKGNINNDF